MEEKLWEKPDEFQRLDVMRTFVGAKIYYALAEYRQGRGRSDAVSQKDTERCRDRFIASSWRLNSQEDAMNRSLQETIRTKLLKSIIIVPTMTFPSLVCKRYRQAPIDV